MSVDYAVTLTAFGLPAAVAVFRARARSEAPLTAELAPELETTPEAVRMREVGDWRVGLNAALAERWSREHPELRFLLNTDKGCGEEVRDELYRAGELVARQTCWFDLVGAGAVAGAEEGGGPVLLFRTTEGNGVALGVALEVEAMFVSAQAWPWEALNLRDETTLQQRGWALSAEVRNPRVARDLSPESAS